MGHTRNEVVRFFKLAVNPVLEGCGPDLEGRGWRINKLQTLDPESPDSWVDGKLTSLIDVSKTEDAPIVKITYEIWVEGSGNNHNVIHDMTLYGGEEMKTQRWGDEIKNRADVYSGSINVTPDRFREEILTFYKKIKATFKHS
jgi:hypothetical protein